MRPALERPSGYPVDFPYIEGAFIYPVREHILPAELQDLKRIVLVYSLSQDDLVALLEKHLHESGWTYEKQAEQNAFMNTIRFIASKNDRHIMASAIAANNSTMLQVVEIRPKEQ